MVPGAPDNESAKALKNSLGKQTPNIYEEV